MMGLARAGRPPSFRVLDNNVSIDGVRIFQDLRDAFGLLRRHRVAVGRMLWEFEGGCLLASQQDEVVRCLVTRRSPNQVEELWPMLEEMQ